MKNIGTTIRIVRELAGIRQVDLAREIGISKNYLCLIEKEKKEPSLRLLQELSLRLDVPVYVFLWNPSGESQDGDEMDSASSALDRLFWEVIQRKVRRRHKIQDDTSLQEPA